MGGIITLTTDFGLDDAYAASVKGVILGINPSATLVDVTHTIKPQDINQAAFVIDAACSYFPSGTIHLIVVDPGVGTKRRAVALRAGDALYVSPDNGTLSRILHRHSASPGASGRALLPDGLEAVVLSNRNYWRETVSSTFHGRDIFAPVAAHLSLGVPLSDLGESTDYLQMLPYSSPETAPDGTITGRVVYIDTFGNLVTDIPSRGIPEESEVLIAGRSIKGLSPSYAEAGGLLALAGSGGYVEISVKDGSAALFLGTRVGEVVKIAAPS